MEVLRVILNWVDKKLIWTLLIFHLLLYRWGKRETPCYQYTDLDCLDVIKLRRNNYTDLSHWNRMTHSKPSRYVIRALYTTPIQCLPISNVARVRGVSREICHRRFVGFGRRYGTDLPLRKGRGTWIAHGPTTFLTDMSHRSTVRPHVKTTWSQVFDQVASRGEKETKGKHKHDVSNQMPGEKRMDDNHNMEDGKGRCGTFHWTAARPSEKMREIRK